MVINFLNSPSDGATHTAGGKTFTYDSTTGACTLPAVSKFYDFK